MKDRFSYSLDSIFANPVDQLSESGKKAVIFCTSCGSRMIDFRQQHGFDRRTGEPSYATVLACPGWDRGAAYQAMRTRWLTSPSYVRLGSPPPEEKFDCANTVRGEWDPAADHAHPETEATLDCTRCVIDMEQAGILSRVEANKAIGKIFTSMVAE